MPKKKVFAARKLKDCLPSLPLKTRKQKKENQSFLSRQFCASLDVYKSHSIGLVFFPSIYLYSDGIPDDPTPEVELKK